MVDQSFGDTAHQHAGDRSLPVRADDEQIGAPLGGLAQDRLQGGAVTDLCDHAGRADLGPDVARDRLFQESIILCRIGCGMSSSAGSGSITLKARSSAPNSV